MTLKDISIGKRFGLLGFGILVAAMVVLVATGAMGVTRMNDRFIHFVQVDMTKIRLVTAVKESVTEIEKGVLIVIVSRGQADRQDALRRIDAARTKYKEALGELERREDQADGRSLITAIKEILVSEKVAHSRAVQFAMAGKTEEASSSYMTFTAPAVQRANRACDRLVKFYEERVGASSGNAQTPYRKTLAILVTMGFFSVGLAAAMTYILSSGIVAPIRQGVTVARMLRGWRAYS